MNFGKYYVIKNVAFYLPSVSEVVLIYPSTLEIHYPYHTLRFVFEWDMQMYVEFNRLESFRNEMVKKNLDYIK